MQQKKHPTVRRLLFLLLAGLVATAVVWGLLLCGNCPWPRKIADTNTLFVAFSGEIKSLDPAFSYFEHEGTILDSIVEMPLEYHYLRRPYELVPMLLEEVPSARYFDKNGLQLPPDAAPDTVARTEYVCHVRKGVFYQPHPCFNGQKRELCAEDFHVALARLCDPQISSPVYSTFKAFLPGMEECSQAIQQAGKAIDYRKMPLECLETIDRYTFKLVLHRQYPQVLYWMAMHFFSPVPWEAVEYFRRPEIAAAGKTLANSPVGTGPYLLAQHIPNAQILLKKNPNYRGTPFPSDGEPGDDLTDAGKTAPFLDQILFFYERESVPAWIKFNQGYYDISGISNDAYDSVISVSPEGALGLSPQMQARGVTLHTSVRLVSYYYGFNMLDPVYGGLSPQKAKLRQAIAIAIDSQEDLEIFMNGRGQFAQCILPPGLPGGSYAENFYNTHVFRWDKTENRAVRRSIEDARALMAEAGYPGGIGPDGKPLTLSYDHAAAGMPGFKSSFLWLKNRLQLIGIELIDNGTDQNRQRDKLSHGNYQFIRRGWVADYPDPENFLLLFYSPNAHIPNGGRGPNYTNYQSAAYDAVFRQLETMTPSPERTAKIQEAERLLMHDTPCVWDFFPASLALVQPWLKNYKPHEVGKTFLRFRRIDLPQRTAMRKAWNRPPMLSPEP